MSATSFVRITDAVATFVSIQTPTIATRPDIGKATRACHYGRLNPKLIEQHQENYGKD